jgi:hypothetical protein
VAGKPRRSRLPPGLAHRLPIEPKQNRRGQEQHGLIDWPGNRQKPESGDPSQRFWNPAIAGDEHHRPDRSDGKGAWTRHVQSLGRHGRGWRVRAGVGSALSSVLGVLPHFYDRTMARTIAHVDT